MNCKKLFMPLLTGLFAFFFVLGAQAQTKTVTGKVTDARMDLRWPEYLLL